ncbi:MAG: acyl-CoA dehydrogenase family protein [Betaproteobacteria bacterium]|jgi:acyl-CoA dehydrogenase
MQTHQWSLWPWPFFDSTHEALAERISAWNTDNHGKVYATMHDECKAMVRSLGAAGLLDYAVPRGDAPFDVRSVCLIREGLTYQHALADAMFAMQGIGTMAIRRFGTDAQREQYLEPCRTGQRIAAFALTEPETGSDVASMTTEARLEGDHYVLNGAKTLISNAGMADHYLVVARTGEAPGARGLTMFLVDAETPGLDVSDPIEFIAPHPAASLRFDGCRVPVANRIGEPGQGFKAAMAAFDIFRPSVGAAGVGLARRALHETLVHTDQRRLFGKAMHGLEGVQMALADMATDLEGAALLVYRAAWAHDVRGERGAYEACMAKLAGSEAAGRIVDRAVQLLGGKGVTRGNIIEQLYREARPMRIYEGASEIQKLVIARNLIKSHAQLG